VAGEYVAELKQILDRWSLEEARTVDIDSQTTDLTVGGQAVSSRGKGMRALLHSAQLLAMSQISGSQGAEAR
jgi:hypothetical protein